MAGKNQKNLSTELRAKFIQAEYPVPFGILDNVLVDEMPYSHKKVIADCFYRAWSYRTHKMGKSLLEFNYLERGPFYKKFHYPKKLLSIMDKFESLGFILKLEDKDETYAISINKFINERHYEK